MAWRMWPVAGAAAIAAAALAFAVAVGDSRANEVSASAAARPPDIHWVLHDADPATAGPARLTGWVGSSTPARITVTLDGAVAARETADIARYDVEAAYGLGPEVGFDIQLDDLPFGTYFLCLRARAGSRRIDMGCHFRTAMPPRSNEPTSRLVINGAGDVYTDPRFFTRRDGTVDFEPILDGLDGLFLEDHLSVVNMDCTPSQIGVRVWKRFNFRCPQRSLRELAREGVDVVSQANNHAMDFGTEAMLDGQDNLRRAGLFPVGNGRTAAEAYLPQLFEVNGWRVAVFAFAEFVEFESWYATDTRAGVASGKDLKAMRAAISDFDPLVDVVVVTVHWGVERTYQLTSGQTRGAAAMVKAGADVVFGHHPHWIQALRKVDGVPVFYSLGNFVWFSLGGPASDSVVGQAVFRPSGRVDACLLDARIDRPGSVVLEGARRC